MKKILTLLIGVCAFQMSAQITLWSNRAGYNQSEVAKYIATDKQGNSYIVGSFTDTTIVGNDTLISQGGKDAFFAKIDKDGNWQWAKAFWGTGGDEEATCVTIAANGNIYVAGTYLSSAIYFSATDSLAQFELGSQGAFFVSYNSSGVLQTKFSCGDYSKDYFPAAIGVTSAGDVIVTGYLTLTTSGVNYFYFRKFNAAGVTQWGGSGETLSHYGNGYGNSIYIDNAGTKVYVAGWWSGSFYPNGLSTNPLNKGGIDIFYMAASVSAGSTTTTDYNTYGSTGNDYGKDVLVDASGNCYLACEYSGSMNIGSSTLGQSATLPAVTKDAVIIKFSTSDNWHWYSRAGGTSGTTVDKLRFDTWGNVFAHGYSTSAVWNHNGAAVTRTYNAKLSKTYGSTLWRSGSSSNVAWYDKGIGVDSVGNVYTFGTFANTINFGNGHSETSVGGNDLYVMKQGSINILYPTEANTKCSNHYEGDTMRVYAYPSYTLNSGNIFNVEIDTLASGVFANPVVIGTSTSSTAGYIQCVLPGFTYGTPSIRVTTSDLANTGEDIWLDVYEKPYLTGPATLTRCLGAATSTVTVNSTLPSDMGGFPSNTYSWSPTTTLTHTTASDYLSDDAHISATTNITYTCTVTNYNGCKDTTVLTVTVLPKPTVFAGNDTTICQGQSVTLAGATAGPNTTYAWTPSGSFSNPTALNATVTTSTVFTSSYTLTVTDTSGCKNTDNITVTRNPLPTVDAGPTGYTTCSGSSVTLIATGAAVASFDWAPAGTLNMTSNDTVVASPTGTTTYTVTATRSNGCTKKDSIKITIANLIVNAGTDASVTCGSSTNLTATPGTGYITPLSYSWFPTTGLSSTTTNTTTATPAATTNYIVGMTTANGCTAKDTVKVTVNEPNYSTSFSASPQLMTSPPFVTQFTNSTPSMSSYNFTWYFGDGTTLASNNTNVFHSYSYNGTYDVTLVATSIATGCSDTLFQGSYIFCTGGTTCTLSATVTAPNGTSGCQGDTIMLQSNTGAGYTYQWNFNGSPISGATNSSYGAVFPGNYSISINDGSCTVVSQPVNVTFNSAPSTPTITPQGSVSICGTGSATLQANSGYSSYSWNTGSTAQSINVSASGVYTVVVSNLAGCTASASYTLNASSATPPSICIAGVDSLTGFNLVVWNKDVTTEIDSFIIYREGTVTNQFDRVGAQPYNAFSTFLDVNSNPAQQSYRYEISLKDTCGIETNLSDYHKTIHLTINAGVGGAWNLIWNSYEGFSVASYNIYRGTDPSNIALLTTVSGSNNSYTDLTPPGGAVYYQIETVGSNCTPSLKMINNGGSVMSVNYNSSRSNIVDNGAIGLNMASDISYDVKSIPNPSNGVFDLIISGNKIGSNPMLVQVFDEIGKIVYSKPVYPAGSVTKETISLPELANGIYSVRVTTGNYSKNIKISVVK